LDSFLCSVRPLSRVFFDSPLALFLATSLCFGVFFFRLPCCFCCRDHFQRCVVHQRPRNVFEISARLASVISTRFARQLETRESSLIAPVVFSTSTTDNRWSVCCCNVPNDERSTH